MASATSGSHRGGGCTLSEANFVSNFWGAVQIVSLARLRQAILITKDKQVRESGLVPVVWD